MRVSAVEQELLSPEIRSYSGALRDAGAKATYGDLLNAVEDGEVPDELLGHLSNVLEVGLQSGRLRRFYGADGEQALARLFHRTPAGAKLASAAREVTTALEALQGQTLANITIAAAGPGGYRLTIDTDRCEITIRMDRAGVDVENLAIGV